LSSELTLKVAGQNPELTGREGKSPFRKEAQKRMGDPLVQ